MDIGDFWARVFCTELWWMLVGAIMVAIIAAAWLNKAGWIVEWLIWFVGATLIAVATLLRGTLAPGLPHMGEALILGAGFSTLAMSRMVLQRALSPRAD